MSKCQAIPHTCGLMHTAVISNSSIGFMVQALLTYVPYGGLHTFKRGYFMDGRVKISYNFPQTLLLDTFEDYCVIAKNYLLLTTQIGIQASQTCVPTILCNTVQFYWQATGFQFSLFFSYCYNDRLYQKIPSYIT